MNASTAATGTTRRAGKGIHAALWLAQILLAVIFGIAGFMKVTMPVPDLAASLVWPGDIPSWLVRFIGTAELAGAIGLVVPALTRIRPGLTPIAAMALATVMVLAALFHITRGEISALGINFFLGALAAFIVWGRIEKAPIAPRR